MTPILQAAEQDHFEVVEYLMKQGADLSATSHEVDLVDWATHEYGQNVGSSENESLQVKVVKQNILLQMAKTGAANMNTSTAKCEYNLSGKVREGCGIQNSFLRPYSR